MLKIKKILRAIFFTPAAWLWEYVYIIRRTLYQCGIFKSYGFEVPIISVGNVTFGGTGKTPFTIWLTKFVEQKSYRPMILTRGYRGAYEHSSALISANKSFRYNPVDFGDEPLLIARRLKRGGVVVGKKRSHNLNYYFHKIQPDVVLLDDGFQHLKLKRNLNIVLFDALLPIDRYQVAPNGYLREGLTSLVDADAIVISRSNFVSKEKLGELKNLLNQYTRPNVVWSAIEYRPTGVYNTNYQKVMDVEELKGKKVVAAAAIASPESFFASLEELGAEVVEKKVFPDHHYFDLKDINELIYSTSKHGAILITSEKDIVKIRKISTEVKVYYVEIEITFQNGQKELESLVDNLVSVHS